MTALAIVLLVLALVAAAAWMALLYGTRRAPPGEGGARAVATTVLGVVAGLAAFGVVAAIIADHAGGTRVKGMTGRIELTPAEQRGRDVFRHVCANCHTLAAARAAGDVGPDLDLVAPPPERTLRVIANGAIGYMAIMPPNLVDRSEARDVAAYVARVARR